MRGVHRGGQRLPCAKGRSVSEAALAGLATPGLPRISLAGRARPWGNPSLRPPRQKWRCSPSTILSWSQAGKAGHLEYVWTALESERPDHRRAPSPPPPPPRVVGTSLSVALVPAKLLT